MAVDIRGRVTCNLGTLISASLNDSYLPNAGYIKTTGTAIIAGFVESSIRPGDDVEFKVAPADGVFAYKIPRYVKCISIRYNPVDRTSRVELGCNFALAENFAENIVWTPADDPENEGITIDDSSIITAPIYARSVADFCLTKLGWMGIDSSLFKQTFSRPEFDFSGGYVQVLGDLMLSSGLVGVGQRANIVNAVLPEGLTCISITENDLISYEPTGTGVPPSSINVDYDTVRLKTPDPEQVAKTNWEVEEVFGTPTTVRISFKNGDETWSSTFNYVPYQKIWRQYDTWDRLVRSVTVNRTIGAAVAASYCQALVQDDANKNVGLGARAISYGNQGFDSTSTVDIKYVIDAPVDISIAGPRTPTVGYEEVLSETQSTYRASAEVLCSVAPGFFDEDDDLISIGDGVAYESLAGDLPPTPLVGILTEQTITTYEQAKRNVTVVTETVKDEEGNESYRYGRLGYFPVTKTITKSAKCYGFTSRGQQDIATRVDQGETLENFASDVLALADDGTEVRIVSGREAVLQARPRAAERILAQSADTTGRASDNGYSTEFDNETLLVGDIKASPSTPLRLRIPYVSDDIFIRTGTPPDATYTSERPEFLPEDAAAAFGKLQGQLIIGSAFGASIQCVGNTMGSDIVGKINIQIGDSSAYYYKNGITYTLSSEGVISGADLIAEGNGGGETAWLPVPTGVSLPPLPTVTSTAPTTLLGTIATVGATPQTALNAAYPGATAGDGVRASDTYSYWVYNGTTWIDVGLVPGKIVANPVVVPMYEVIVSLRGTTRTSVTVTSIPYGLTLLTVLPALTVRSTVAANRYRLTEVPAAGLALGAFAPQVSAGITVRPPAADIAIAAPVPAVGASIGTSVSVPSGTVTIAAGVPTVSVV